MYAGSDVFGSVRDVFRNLGASLTCQLVDATHVSVYGTSCIPSSRASRNVTKSVKAPHGSPNTPQGWFHPKPIGKGFKPDKFFQMDSVQPPRIPSSQRTWLAGKSPIFNMEDESSIWVHFPLPAMLVYLRIPWDSGNYLVDLVSSKKIHQKDNKLLKVGGQAGERVSHPPPKNRVRHPSYPPQQRSPSEK